MSGHWGGSGSGVSRVGVALRYSGDAGAGLAVVIGGPRNDEKVRATLADRQMVTQTAG